MIHQDRYCISTVGTKLPGGAARRILRRRVRNQLNGVVECRRWLKAGVPEIRFRPGADQLLQEFRKSVEQAPGCRPSDSNKGLEHVGQSDAPLRITKNVLVVGKIAAQDFD